MKHEYLVKKYTGDLADTFGCSYGITYVKNGSSLKEVVYYNKEYTEMMLQEFIKWKPNCVIKVKKTDEEMKGLERSIEEYRENLRRKPKCKAIEIVKSNF